jgi:hypothetical protein
MKSLQVVDQLQLLAKDLTVQNPAALTRNARKENLPRRKNTAN